MQIVTDSGTDIGLSPKELEDLNIHIVPLVVTLDGKSYREGLDIQPDEFYDLLDASESMPVTSQPSAGDFAEVYRRLAAVDSDILSIHMTSGLSGTYHSAIGGSKMVPEANITHIDTKTLSAAAGWQVIAAARACKAGWKIEKITDLLKQIGDATESMYTLKHMKGLIASLLNIKPMIGVEKVNGTYIQLGQARTFKNAVQGLVDRIKAFHPPGTSLYVQVLHAFNPDGGEALRELVDKTFNCTWLPMRPMSLVLGAHTGRSMVGVAFAKSEVLARVPAS